MSKIQINAVVLLCISSIWLAAVSSVPPFKSPVKIHEDFPELADQMGEWQAIQTDVKHKVEGLITASSVDKVYRNPQGDVVVLTVVYTSAMNDLHQPEGCLGGQGWSIGDQRVTQLQPETGEPFDVNMNRMSSDSDGGEQVVTYWFQSKHTKSRLLSVHKVKLYINRLRTREAPNSLMVRIMAPIRSDTHQTEIAARSLSEQVSPQIDALIARPPNVRPL